MPKSGNFNEWIVVQFEEDEVIYMCSKKSITKQLTRKTCMVKWTNKMSYKAIILQSGSKESMKKYLNSIIKKKIPYKSIKKDIKEKRGASTMSNFTLETFPGLDEKNGNFGPTDETVVVNGKCDTSIPVSENFLNVDEKNSNFGPTDETVVINGKCDTSIPVSETRLSEPCHEYGISDNDIEVANEVMSKILAGIHSADESSTITEKKIVKRFPGLNDFKSHDDENIIRFPELQLEEFNETSSEEFYLSPEYTPPSENKDISESDESDIDYNPVTSRDSLQDVVIFDNQINDMDVQRAKKNPAKPNKLVKDKKIYCIFCNILVTNFPRHIERKHALELEVRKLITLPKKSKDRLKELELLKNKGNLYYNKNVLSNKKGSLIVGRRPNCSTEIDVKDYLPCNHCFKFLKKHQLYRHIKKCVVRKVSDKDVPSRRNRLTKCAALLQSPNDDKQLYSEVFSRMKYDDISLTAQQDKLICAFGIRLLKNHREHHQKAYISQRIRQVAKFLIILRSMVPENKHLQDFLVPKFFETIVAASKKLSGYDEVKNTYTHPSVALKIGHSILQCTDVLDSQLIIQNANETKLQEVRNFSKLFQKEWKFSISSNACKDQSKKKFNKTIDLPDSKDIILLHSFLSDQVQKLKNLIEKNKENIKDSYKTLCQHLLTQIILLNRRRSGEVERIKIEDFLNRDKKKIQEDIHKSLTDVETKLCQNFIRFEIMGKRGRGVPVLLTPDMKQSLDLILKIRISANVLEQNEYLFAIPNTMVGVYRGSECLRKAAIDCGASKANLLTSTKLRKHIATMSQLLNLTSNDREQLANFMGHDLSIHNQYYRLPDDTLQLSRVTKILLAVESGQLHKLKGKSLEEFDSIMPNYEDSSGSDNLEDESNENSNFLNPPILNNDVSGNENLEIENKLYISKTSKKRGDYLKWTADEINAIKRSLGRFIALKKIPQQYDCLLAIKNEPILEKRGWKKVKFQVANLIKKNVD